METIGTIETKSLIRLSPSNRRLEVSDTNIRFSAPAQGLPIVSIVVPFFGLTNYILRNLQGIPKKELQWRLQVGFLTKAWVFS